MSLDAHPGKRFDTKTWVIRTFKNCIIIILAALGIKFLFIDSITIYNDQMSPSIVHGDRLLVFKTLSLPGLKNLIHPSINTPVIFNVPHQQGRRNCLRVAAGPMDTVFIDSAQFLVNGIPFHSPNRKFALPELLPVEYSPRDFFAPYRIPAAGDTLHLDSLSIRDFFFAYSIISQESTKDDVTFKTNLIIDDSITNDYIIDGFSLYSGPFSELPDTLQADWFFWTQLKRYLENAYAERDVELRFKCIKNGETIRWYKVTSSLLFLRADNWVTGFDSRYFGPALESSVIGRPFMVWWSHNAEDSLKSIKVSRIGRLVL